MTAIQPRVVSNLPAISRNGSLPSRLTSNHMGTSPGRYLILGFAFLGATMLHAPQLCLAGQPNFKDAVLVGPSSDITAGIVWGTLTAMVIWTWRSATVDIGEVKTLFI